MRLIDADVIIEEVCGDCKTECHFCDDAWMISVIEQAPTVDAVEVIRCKDCRNGKRGADNIVLCNHPSGKIIMMTAYGFCSYGKGRNVMTDD